MKKPKAAKEAPQVADDRTGSGPWLLGIIDALVGARLLRESRIPHRNRLAMILLDSTLETASRVFLTRVKKIKLTDAHKDRATLTKLMKSSLPDIDPKVWESLNYYHEDIRNDLYHESSGKTLTDETYLDYEDTVQFVIDHALGIRIADKTQAALIDARPLPAQSEAATTGDEDALLLAKAKDSVSKVLVAVAAAGASSAKDVNEYFRRQGESLRLKPKEFTRIVAVNTGSKRLFYFDRATKVWGLTGLGRFRYGQLTDIGGS